MRRSDGRLRNPDPEHQSIANMFDEIATTSNTEADRRQLLFSSLAAILEDHEITEEVDFLPEVLDASRFSAHANAAMITELVAEIFDDHSEFEAMSQQIANSRANDDEWLERVNELRDLVREHVRQEEEKLFPASQKVLDQQRAEEIGRLIEAKNQKEA